MLETELTNKGALRLYENLGFVRHKLEYAQDLSGHAYYSHESWGSHKRDQELHFGPRHPTSDRGQDGGSYTKSVA